MLILALLKADAADRASNSSSQAVAAAAAAAAPITAAEVAGAAPQAFGGVQYSQLEAEKQVCGGEGCHTEVLLNQSGGWAAANRVAVA